MRNLKKTNPPFSPFVKGGNKTKFQSFLSTEGPALLVLTASFLLCFRDWLPHFTTRIFLSLDSTVLYYPVYTWVHQHLTQGKLPLICDLSYHGAPVAAVSMAGVLSPVLWIFHLVSSPVVMMNLLFLAPFAIFLFGAYFLGRQWGFSPSAGVLLAFLWTYNGQRMAQLDHWNVAWACSFFPWAFLALLRYCGGGRFFWLVLSGLLWGLCLLSGHPQLFFLEGLFLLLWALFSPALNRPKLPSFFLMSVFACLTAAPLLLFTVENLGMGGLQFQWGPVDRFFHSWTPFNFLTLVFPWFFGRDQFDRQGSDYWWQYQFVEMQVAFSIAGLFFILLFFLKKSPQRRWITITSLFGLAMALGKFFLVYSWIQSLPFFSWFRDPARYWHITAWALGLGAAYAWDEWFKDEILLRKGRKLSLSLSVFGFLIVVTGWFMLMFGRTLLESAASWGIRHFLLGDSLHPQPLSAYLARVPEKLDLLSLSLNPRNPAVFIPLLFLATLAVSVWNRKNWNLDFQRGLLLALVFADLMIFRMPLGSVFYKPSDIPPPAYPAPVNRSLVMLYKNTSPLPVQYGEMAYPNMNLVSGRPNLVVDANPALPGYRQILKDFGWFSWVYHDRDPLGFSKQPGLLRALGVDQIVSDSSLPLSIPFKKIRNRYPFVYSLPGARPKAFLGVPGSSVAVPRWDETNLVVLAQASAPGTLVLQKTFLPGWKAFLNGSPVKSFLTDKVLTGLALPGGKNRVELKYKPTSLRLGYFLFFLFFTVFTFSFFRRRVA